MKSFIIFISLFFNIILLSGQQNNIKIYKLPSEVEIVLNEYIKILSKSENIEICANQFIKIAGGNLVDETGKNLRSSIKPYSLKKDFEDILFYKLPLQIIKIEKSQNKSSGYGKSAIIGDWYKIYIAKKDGSLPAPIHIIVPKNNSEIKTPKIVGIGSL
jgi:hypothetical protein